MPLISLFLQPNLLLAVCDATKDGKGNMQEVVHLGPGFDGGHNIAVTHPEGMKEIFLNEEIFVKPASSILFMRKLLGRGLATSAGDVWKSQRKFLAPIFQSTSLKNLVHPIADETSKWTEKICETKEEYSEVKSLYSELSLSTIVRVIFGSEIDAKWVKDQWSQVLSEMNFYFLTWQAFGKIADFSPFGLLFSSSRGILRNKVKDWIEERRKENSIENSSLLNSMIRATDEETGESIPTDLIIDQVLTFLLNGHDSCSALMTWATYFISCSPEIQTKLQKEVDSVLGGNLPTWESLYKLKYLKSVLEETLRARPPFAMIDRVAASDTQIMGHKIPKGTTVYAFIQALHLNSNEWKNPLSFEPERFSEVKSDNWSYLPFLGGPRNCIGEKLGFQEAMISLAIVVQKFTISRDESKTVYPKVGLTTEPESFYAKFVPRK